MNIDKLVLTTDEKAQACMDYPKLYFSEAVSLATVKKAEPLIRQDERERIMKIFASFGKIQLAKPLSGKEFEALFDRATVEKEG